MGEGVDPTQMCQSLVDKVTRSQQLMAVADPELMVLFEEWLEELEKEVEAFAKKSPSLNPSDLARNLGISRAGAVFLITKLKRNGRL